MRGGVVEGRKGLEWSNKQQHGDDVPLRCATSARRQQTTCSFPNPLTWRTSGNFRGLRSWFDFLSLSLPRLQQSDDPNRTFLCFPFSTQTGRSWMVINNNWELFFHDEMSLYLYLSLPLYNFSRMHSFSRK